MKTSIIAIPILLLLLSSAAKAQQWNACSDQLAAATQAQNIGPQPRGANHQADSAGFQRGYVDGIEVGGHDRMRGKGEHPHKYDWYKSATRCYRKQYGDKSAYKSEYRMGFDKGYAEAYGKEQKGQ
ncbi:MAG TPA: hypothetical protein VG322_00030 [Candidatus Acidoferrales bacterium]|nr:hypothetical protein [Candidatus Acidoferrales bacterium]